MSELLCSVSNSTYCLQLISSVDATKKCSHGEKGVLVPWKHKGSTENRSVALRRSGHGGLTLAFVIVPVAVAMTVIATSSLVIATSSLVIATSSLVIVTSHLVIVTSHLVIVASIATSPPASSSGPLTTYVWPF
ncbi:hypothetical protein P280DRAFT_513472 [Massarina eburnea CBS 473.64]|uniref:Uncharacterized protein n=1 Tax=Massarina eburnea CBS 473.64 TaxID=1395130 RepID=A0A6A6SCJ7_9PLEO|nr:hypothetical protein P280DRAFT_513472 [Massarina eburnea CBS 473.64]